MIFAQSQPAVHPVRNVNSMRAEYDFSKGKRAALLPQQGKTRISIFIDNAVLQAFRAEAEKRGTGYQTMMNDALRRYLVESSEPLTKAELLRVIRQEIPALLRDPTNHPSARRRSASAGKN
jgi:uncharacterized protein (DUF4415 family)